MDIPIGYYYAAIGAYYKMAAVLADIGAADVLDSMLPITKVLNSQVSSLRDGSAVEEDLKAFCDQAMQEATAATDARNERLQAVMNDIKTKVAFVEYLKEREARGTGDALQGTASED